MTKEGKREKEEEKGKEKKEKDDHERWKSSTIILSKRKYMTKKGKRREEKGEGKSGPRDRKKKISKGKESR